MFKGPDFTAYMLAPIHYVGSRRQIDTREKGRARREAKRILPLQGDILSYYIAPDNDDANI